MSFILQGNIRQLRFSGETAVVSSAALVPASPPAPIGRPRVRRPRRAAPEELDAMMCFSPWPLGAWTAKPKVARRATRVAADASAPPPQAAAAEAAPAVPAQAQEPETPNEPRQQTQPLVILPPVTPSAPTVSPVVCAPVNPAPKGSVTPRVMHAVATPAPMSLQAPVSPLSIRRKIGELAVRFPGAIAKPRRKLAIPLFGAQAPREGARRAAPFASETRSSLRIWLVASVLIGFVSYEVASHVVERVAPPSMTASR